MSKDEHIYDILDVLRVVKSVWLLVIAVPVLAGLTVGWWAYNYTRTAALPHVAAATFSMPVGALTVAQVQLQLADALDVLKLPSTAFAIVVQELAGDPAAARRTVRISVSSYAAGDGIRIIELAAAGMSSVAERHSASIGQSLGAIEQRRQTLVRLADSLSGYVPGDDVAETAAASSALASLVSVSQQLDVEARRLTDLGQGPLEVIAPINEYVAEPDMKWIRLPIAAAFAGLLAVLGTAFTLDGIRLSLARRRSA